MKKKYKEDLYCYIRVSTTVQKTDGDSLESQKYYGQLVSEQLGMNYVEILEGVSTSRKRKKDERLLDFLQSSGRDEYEDLKQLIESGKCRNLWFMNNERLHRVNVQTLLFFEDYVDRFNVKTFVGTTGTQILRDTIEQNFQFEQNHYIHNKKLELEDFNQ